MNYSRSLSKKGIAKRMIFSWVVVAVVSVVIGSFIGYAVRTHISKNEGMKTSQGINESALDEFAVYGAYDDRIFTNEISLDWENDSTAFEPFSVRMKKEDQEFLYYLCKGYNIDFDLAMSVIQVESDYEDDLISGTDDYGLMQINKMNHAELTKILGVTDYLDPEQNMRAGCYILRKLFEKYQSPSFVLMAYNMGETGAKRLWREGVYETEYTQKVFAAQKKLQKEGKKK